jgi:predicted phosphohydrolase
MGNHDFWADKQPSLDRFILNYDKAVEAFKTYNIHFLDCDGVFSFRGLTVVGCSGWYLNRPDSNDWNFIPKYIEGDTHLYMLKKAEYLLQKNLDQLSRKDKNRVFMSHFPVMDCNHWDWNPRFGEMLHERYNINYFISGHSHGEKNGPMHFRSATDYYKPQFKILEIQVEEKENATSSANDATN